MWRALKSIMKHLSRMIVLPASVAVALVLVSGTLATDLPRKAFSGTISAIDTSSLTVQDKTAASREVGADGYSAERDFQLAVLGQEVATVAASHGRVRPTPRSRRRC